MSSDYYIISKSVLETLLRRAGRSGGVAAAIDEEIVIPHTPQQLPQHEIFTSSPPLPAAASPPLTQQSYYGSSGFLKDEVITSFIEKVDPTNGQGDAINQGIPNALSHNPERVNTHAEVMKAWELLETLHANSPKHEIFGYLEVGKVRAPLAEWRAKIVQLAAHITQHTGRTMHIDGCFMAAEENIQFRRSHGARDLIFEVQTTRLLLFLKKPTETRWLGLKKVNPPNPQARDFFSACKTLQFCHFCANGRDSKRNTRPTIFCVNGLNHGAMGTKADRTSIKACRFRNRDACPGHGPDGSWLCVFVHPNGHPKPCFNGVGPEPTRCGCPLVDGKTCHEGDQ